MRSLLVKTHRIGNALEASQALLPELVDKGQLFIRIPVLCSDGR